jgi:ABC-type branched-subunit amino acid transport system permease subunit
MIYFGLLFMAVVLFKPEGIAGLYQTGTRKWSRRPG